MEYTYISGLFIGWAFGFIFGVSFGVYYTMKRTKIRLDQIREEDIK